jgi:hypothetical protein
MRQQLAPLIAELAIWRDQGLVLPSWWRDDDATAPTPALERLLAMAAAFNAPLHLAIVPEPAVADLAERLRGASKTFALPHGWRHRNHAPPDDKKAEFGAHRPVEIMLDEIAQGWRRLEKMFGSQALPIFTPPWNRATPAVVGGLSGTGLRAISTSLPRRARYAAENLLQVNTHLDPIDWRGGRGLLDPKHIAADLVVQLSDRRENRADNSEPFGLLTHHLVHDESIWSFMATLIEVLTQSGVAKWTSPLDEIGF